MKHKVDPLVEHGHKVFIPYTNSSAFVVREAPMAHALRPPTASPALQDWLRTNAGPLGVLWTTQKVSAKGINIFFYNKTHALMAKLTWGGC